MKNNDVNKKNNTMPCCVLVCLADTQQLVTLMSVSATNSGTLTIYPVLPGFPLPRSFQFIVYALVVYHPLISPRSELSYMVLLLSSRKWHMHDIVCSRRNLLARCIRFLQQAAVASAGSGQGTCVLRAYSLGVLFEGVHAFQEIFFEHGLRNCLLYKCCFLYDSIFVRAYDTVSNDFFK